MSPQPVTITDAVLEGIAMQVLNMAKHDMERNQFNFLFASYHGGDTIKLHRMTKIEALFIAQLGEGWLNDGSKKDRGFYLLRLALKHLPPDAFAFASVVDAFGLTAKFRELPQAAQEELLKASSARRRDAVKEGLLSMRDALSVVVQTPERVCICHQLLDSHRQPEGKPDMNCVSQAEFEGRIKMFG